VAAAGRFDNVVKISPPLTIDEGELERAADIVVEAIGAAA
jgi:4-aminobutyrate aminotransferase-like enzyme